MLESNIKDEMKELEGDATGADSFGDLDLCEVKAKTLVCGFLVVPASLFILSHHSALRSLRV